MKQKIELEIPKHILAQAASVASKFQCTPKTLLLAGIISIVEEGNKLKSINESDKLWRFALRLGRVETICKKVPNIIAEYINAHSGYFTTYETANEKHPWVTEPIRGEIAGRYTVDKTGVTLSIPWRKLCTFAGSKKINNKKVTSMDIGIWADAIEANYAPLKLASGSSAKAVYCICLPVIEELETS